MAVGADDDRVSRHRHRATERVAGGTVGGGQLPGLRRYDVSKRPIVSLSPGETPYIVATLYFDSLDAIRAAFASEIGKACAVDRRKYAPEDDDTMMLLFDSEAM